MISVNMLGMRALWLLVALSAGGALIYRGYVWQEEQRHVALLHDAELERQTQEKAEQFTSQRRAQALAALHFEDDPENRLPLYSVQDFVLAMYLPRKALQPTRGQLFKLTARLANDQLGSSSLTFVISPKPLLIQTLSITFPRWQLEHISPGDEVVFTAVFLDDLDNEDVAIRAVMRKTYFKGVQIEKIS